MAKYSHERYIHYKYTPELREWWQMQDANFRKLCLDTGTEKGASGYQTFYQFLVKMFLIEAEEYEDVDWEGDDC